MADLIRSLIVAGLMSGTQPITIMGLLLLRTGPGGVRKSFAFLAGAFTIETLLLLFANLVFGGEVKADSAPGMSFLLIRVVLGIALLVVGLRWRKPPKHEAPEVPRALDRLRNIGLVGAFISGVLLADYVGPVIASLAITTSTATLGGRLLATLVYTALATGIPAAFLIISITSDTAGQRLDGTMSWVMGHRRQLASWIALILGVLLIGDGIVGLILLGD